MYNYYKINLSVSAKLDIGVHKNFDIKQEEYCFNLEAINESAILIINSKEKIICEKLKSLLRFGIRTTRYKDIFDIYYLINNIQDIVKSLNITLNNNIFKRNLKDTKNNWLDISVDEVVNNVINYFTYLEKIIV